VDGDRLLTAFLGALFGAGGWLIVGMFIQRAQVARAAKNAGRAVWFELSVNRIAVDLARQHDSFEPLNRASYDRLLPELATWLRAEELLTIARAYMGHAGYQQLSRDRSVPSSARRLILTALADGHRAAAEVLRKRVFSAPELHRMRSLGPDMALLVDPAADG
jgi:hypothetical protein